MNDQYFFSNIETIDSPAILVYPALIKHNIAKAIEIAGGSTLLRPHIKTHKMVEVSKMLLQAGIDKFKCATIAEAEMLVIAGAKDILLAYQPTAVKAARLAKLAGANPDVLFGYLVDNEASAAILDALLHGANLRPWIDINVGMNRTGTPVSNVISLYGYFREQLNATPSGLHAYDGHIHDTDTKARFAKAAAIYRDVSELSSEITGKYNTSPHIVLGGTPCFPYYSGKPGIESSPGTFVFWDAGYTMMFPDMDFSISALLLTRVISIIDAHTICLDLGHKSVAPESPLPRVYFPDHPEASVMGQSEEHLVVKVPDSVAIKIGEAWLGIPNHICPTVALYDHVHVIENQEAVSTWKVIARDRVINF